MRLRLELTKAETAELRSSSSTSLTICLLVQTMMSLIPVQEKKVVPYDVVFVEYKLNINEAVIQLPGLAGNMIYQ